MGMRGRRRRGSDKPKNGDEREVPEVDIKITRLIRYLRPYIPRLMVAVVALLFSAALNLVFPALIGGVGNIPGVMNSVLSEQNIELLDDITLVLFVAFLLRAVSGFIENYNLNFIGERLVVDIRKELYEKLQQLSLKFFVERRVGELVSRISSDVTVMRTALTSNVTVLLSQVLILVGSIIVMFVINMRLSMFIIVLIPVVAALWESLATICGKLAPKFKMKLQVQLWLPKRSCRISAKSKVSSGKTTKLTRYNGAIDRAFRAAVKLLRIRSVFGPVGAFLGFGGLAAIVWFGGREVIEGRLTPGELVAFLIYGMTVAGSFGSLIGLYSSFQEALGAMKRVFQIMDLTPEIDDSANAQELDKVNGRITFENVGFSYDERITSIRQHQSRYCSR